jgi:hypothetical protein
MSEDAGDKALPAELRELVQTWRTHYELVALEPRLQDLRATLQALAGASDEEATAAAGALDGWTEARLATAALRAFRRDRGVDARIPAGELHAETWSAERIRVMAKSALEELPPSSGGAPSTRARDRDFMRALLACWNRTHAARRISFEQREVREVMDAHRLFPKFARAMFALIGRDLKSTQLRALRTEAKKRLG